MGTSEQHETSGLACMSKLTSARKLFVTSFQYTLFNLEHLISTTLFLVVSHLLDSCLDSTVLSITHYRVVTGMHLVFLLLFAFT